MILVLHSDIIPGDLASNIWRNNAHKISYIREKANITERRLNGEWMARTRNGHWMVPEMYLPFSRLKGDWKVTERWLNVREWWCFVLRVTRVSNYGICLRLYWGKKALCITQTLRKHYIMFYTKISS